MCPNECPLWLMTSSKVVVRLQGCHGLGAPQLNFEVENCDQTAHPGPPLSLACSVVDCSHHSSVSAMERVAQTFFKKQFSWVRTCVYALPFFKKKEQQKQSCFSGQLYVFLVFLFLSLIFSK